MITNLDLERHIGKYYGKYSGVVVDNHDAKTSGLLQVQIPTMFGKKTVPARPCFPTAHFFVPKIGDQVWIEFEAGNPSYALWVGCWYASGTVPPEAAVNPPDNRVIQTPSGHTVEFADKSGEEKILIRHKGNAFVSIDKNGSVLIANQKGSSVSLDADQQNITILEQHSNVITMTSDGITIANKSGTTIEIKDDGVRVLATGTVQISAKSLALQGSAVNIGPQPIDGVIMPSLFGKMYDGHTHATALGPSGPPIPAPGPPQVEAAVSHTVKVSL
jgi:hypothetical protein